MYHSDNTQLNINDDLLDHSPKPMGSLFNRVCSSCFEVEMGQTTRVSILTEDTTDRPSNSNNMSPPSHPNKYIPAELSQVHLNPYFPAK